MRRLVALALGLCAAASTMCADGGAVVLQGRSGSLEVSVFAMPSPLRVGPADFSVLVQNADTNDVLLNGVVELRFGRQGANEIRIRPTPGEASNKLLYAASVDLPEAGDWSLTAQCRVDGETANLRGKISVLAPEPPLLNYWPYFLIVPLAIALFVMNQVLKGRRRTARAQTAG